MTHWKRTWFWERMRAGGEGDNQGWDGWMASLTRLTWIWASSRSWWWTGKSGMLQSMGSQRVRHNWATELNTSIPNSLTIPYPHPPLRFVLSLRTHEDIKASCAGNLSSGKEEKRHNLGRKGRRDQESPHRGTDSSFNRILKNEHISANWTKVGENISKGNRSKT